MALTSDPDTPQPASPISPLTAPLRCLTSSLRPLVPTCLSLSEQHPFPIFSDRDLGALLLTSFTLACQPFVKFSSKSFQFQKILTEYVYFFPVSLPAVLSTFYHFPVVAPAGSLLTGNECALKRFTAGHECSDSFKMKVSVPHFFSSLFKIIPT